MADVGLDVGYGKQRSCGLAVRSSGGSLASAFPARERYIKTYAVADGRTVEAVTLRKGEFTSAASSVRGVLGDSALITDGMLAPTCRPRQARPIDARAMTGDFQNRAVPSSVVGGGAALVDATYEILESVFGSGLNSFLCFGAGGRTRTGPVVLETNPTVGLAVLVGKIADVSSIPSRSSGGGAKSDFYWLKGGGSRVAAVLGAGTVAAEGNHELRAGLYALAVAAQISGDAADGSLPVVVGDAATGVYALLGPVHPSWSDAVLTLGLVP